MTIPTQREKAIRLRELHGGTGILVLANAWDAISARLIEDVGFPAIATSSAGVANTLGYPDGERIPREEMLFMARRIARTVRVPVTVDIEAAYGANSVEETLKTVQGVLDAGCVGINLEDSVDVEATTLVDLDLQIEKIRAIRSLADEVGVPLVINARTDAFHTPALGADNRFAFAVERVNAYRAAGADSLFVPFVKDAPTIEALVKAVHGPLNVLAVPGTPPIAELERLGVARVSVGSGLMRATLALARQAAEELHDQGAYTTLMAHSIPYADLNRLLARTN